MSTIEIISVASSSGGSRSGLEEAPDALRAAGLADALLGRGLQVLDQEGEASRWRWRADAVDVSASNGAATIEAARYAEKRVRQSRAAGRVPLVLGGDCTIEIGVVAAQVEGDGRLGLIYIDGHTDLNVPGSAPEGVGEFTESLDWMGVAHLLDLPRAYPPLAGFGPRRPLLRPNDVAVLGWVPDQASAAERRSIAEIGLHIVDWQTLARDPEGRVAELLAGWGVSFDRLAVHLDVDVLDYAQTPIADTSASRGVGLSLDQLGRVLASIVADPRFASLTITEINPAATEKDAFDPALLTFIDQLAEALRPLAGGQS